MKTKFYWVALLASAALIAQAQGGGGHFGGGAPHFGGGGHFGGGAPHFGGSGHFGGGVPHFGGGGRFGGGVPHFGGGGPRFSPSGAPQSQIRPPAFAGPNRRFTAQSARSAATFNRRPGQFGSEARQHARVSGARASTSSSRGAFEGGRHVFARHDGNWHRDWDRGHDHFWRGHRCRFVNGGWIIFDTGFYPDDYYGYGYPYDYYPYDDQDYYAGVDPNDYGYDASIDPYSVATVRAVQSQLARQGYYHGVIDGVYGSRTRTALRRYQSDHRLQVTGSLTMDTLRSLGLPQATSG